ncbi:MAG: dCTP deaminase domain-containing protein [Fusobacteriaceae bacterium]
MFVRKEDIKNYGVIQNFDENLLRSISYDLTIENIINFSDKNEKTKNYTIDPQETIYIESAQILQLPNNLVGIVHGKNSRIRQGLDLVSPIYQPGHKTRVFFRLTNISSSSIELKKGDRVGQISFALLNAPTSVLYDGTFADEMDYRGLGDYDKEYVSKRIEHQKESLEKIESKLYATVAVLMALFISIFSMININANMVLNNNHLVREGFLFMNLSIVGSIAMIFGLTSLILKKSFFIYFICFVISISSYLALYSL